MPLTASYGAGCVLAPFSSAAARRYSVSLISVDLPEPETPVTQVNRPAGNAASTSCRLLPLAPVMRSHAVSSMGWRRCCRHLDRAYAGQELPGDRAWRVQDVLHTTLRHDFAAVHARAGTDVDDVVGRADRVLVVLDHDHRVAEVAQPGQRAEQALVVALMQADGRLVEHIHHADQAGADLRGEADALRLAAGQRVGLAIQREVVQADVVEEDAGRLADFLDDLAAISPRQPAG